MRSVCIFLFTVMAIVNLPGITFQYDITIRPCPEGHCKPKDVPSECSAPLEDYEPCPGVNEICCVLPSRRVDEDACVSRGGKCDPFELCFPMTGTEGLCPTGQQCCSHAHTPIEV